ncbi:MAG: hypothetical protein ABSH32_11405 [Bryobacteraceae bacterium]|jgi:hypothetical protein
MKIVQQLGLCCLLASGAFAQHSGGGAGHGGFGGGHAGFTGGVRAGNHGGYGRGFRGNLGFRGLNRGFYGGYFYSPDYYDYGYSAYSDSYGGGPNVTVVYPPPAPAYPPVVETAHPVMHEYHQAEDYGLPAEQQSSPVLYLIAFRDKIIRPATTFWVEGDTLHYLGTDHKEQRVPLSSVDEDLSTQLNRERHVPFHL